MNSVIATRPYTSGEEICHSLIHGIGIVLSVAALAVLVGFFRPLRRCMDRCLHHRFRRVNDSALYGFDGFITPSPTRMPKKILKKFDHIAIYYLIAGSYTPFLLVNLRGLVGWSIFGIIWSLLLPEPF